MAGESGFAGKQVTFEISWDNVTFIRFGSVRGKTQSTGTETADSTADDSAGGFREVIETFKTQTNSWDGVVKTDTRGDTLDRFEAFVYDNSLEDGPDALPLTSARFFVRTIRPKTNSQTRSITRCVQLTSFEIGAPYDDVTSFSMEAQTINDPVLVDA